MWLWLCQDDKSDGSDDDSDEEGDDEAMEEDEEEEEEDEEDEMEEGEVDQNFRLELMKVLKQQNALVGFQAHPGSTGLWVSQN